MDLSTSSVELNKDLRGTLYYNKYNYRARLRLKALNRTYYLDTIDEFKRRLYHRVGDKDVIRRGFEDVNFVAIEKYIEWRRKYFKEPGKNRKLTLRVEGSVASVFSNDLDLLKTLEEILGPGTVTYSIVDMSVPTGVRYFKHEPKHNYRCYLKSKRVENNFKQKMISFLDRYKDTSTVILPSNAFKKWLREEGKTGFWYTNYCSSHYFLDYNEESVNSLIGIMFGDMIKCRYKLEKLTDTV